MNVEAMGKSQRSALLDIRGDVVRVDLGDLFVGQKNHDHVSRFNGVVNFHHIQAGFANLVPRRAAFAQTDNNLDTAVVQILCVRMTLATVPDDGHGLALDQAQVAIFVVENFHSYLQKWWWRKCPSTG